MAAAHETFEATVEGHRVLGLRSPAGLELLCAPGAGLVCCSFKHRDAELLGQREGLRAYAERGATMGVPLLHPWANRLARCGYRAGGAEVEFPQGATAVRLDGATDLPIHGLLSGWPGWEVVTHSGADSLARLEARLDVTALPEVAPLFPFEHELRIRADLRDETLRLTTTLTPTGEAAVPIAFGFHPYFTLPGVPREEWHLTLPVRS